MRRQIKRQRYTTHQIEDDLESIFIKLKTKLDILEQLVTIFKDTMDPVIQKQIQLSKQEIRNEIKALLMRKVNILDIYAKLGASVFKAQIFQAQDYLKALQQKNGDQVIDLVNEDSELYDRLVRQQRQQQYGNLYADYDYPQILQPNISNESQQLYGSILDILRQQPVPRQQQQQQQPRTPQVRASLSLQPQKQQIDFNVESPSISIEEQKQSEFPSSISTEEQKEEEKLPVTPLPFAQSEHYVNPFSQPGQSIQQLSFQANIDLQQQQQSIDEMNKLIEDVNANMGNLTADKLKQFDQMAKIFMDLKHNIGVNNPYSELENLLARGISEAQTIEGMPISQEELLQTINKYNELLNSLQQDINDPDALLKTIQWAIEQMYKELFNNAMKRQQEEEKSAFEEEKPIQEQRSRSKQKQEKMKDIRSKTPVQIRQQNDQLKQSIQQKFESGQLEEGVSDLIKALELFGNQTGQSFIAPDSTNIPKIARLIMDQLQMQDIDEDYKQIFKKNQSKGGWSKFKRTASSKNDLIKWLKKVQTWIQNKKQIEGQI